MVTQQKFPLSMARVDRVHVRGCPAHDVLLDGLVKVVFDGAIFQDFLGKLFCTFSRGGAGEGGRKG